MRLQVRCLRCRGSIRSRTIYDSKGEFARSKGDFVEMTCTQCQNMESYHLNEISAVQWPYFPLAFGIAIALSLFSFVFVYYWNNLSGSQELFVSMALTVPITAVGLALNENRKKVQNFNRTSIKKKKELD